MPIVAEGMEAAKQEVTGARDDIIVILSNKITVLDKKVCFLSSRVGGLDKIGKVRRDGI